VAPTVGSETVAFGVNVPPVHKYVTPAVVEPPFSTVTGVPQLTVSPTALTFGRFVSPVTVADAVAVQPLPPAAVMVTV